MSSSSVPSRCLITILLVVLGAPAVYAQEDFTVIVLPDPQNYSEFFPDIFKAQTQWIVKNRAALNIKFVIEVGDTVNDALSHVQYQNADAAIDILDTAGVPYAIAVGDHDYVNRVASTRNPPNFNTYFGPARYSGSSWYEQSFQPGSNENFYAEFEAGGKEYVVLVLEMHPRDSVLEWADSVVRSEADAEIIVVTHSFIYSDNTRVDACDTHDVSPQKGNTPEMLWEKFVSRHKNIIMVLSGHITTGSGVGRRTDRANEGNLVNQMLSTYQDWEGKASGYLRILTFRPSINKIEVKTYSPTQNKFLTGAQHQFTLDYHYAGSPGTGTGSVSGKVRSKACAVIAGAEVSAGGRSTTSDTTGTFSLALPAPNTYEVRAQGANWIPDTQTRAVREGYSTQLDFYLAGAPDFRLAVAPATVTVRPGQTASYTIQISPENGFRGDVLFACSGIPKGANCSFSPNPAKPPNGNAAGVQLSISTSATAALFMDARPLGGHAPLGIAWPLVAIAAVLPVVRRRISAVHLLVLVAFALFLLSCGGTPQEAQPPPGSEPPTGTFSVTIRGTSGSLERSTTAQLVIK